MEPQFSLIFNPFGLTPIANTFAPKDFNNSGPALYPAPFAQSITILNPLKLNSFGKFCQAFLNILLSHSNLFTLPNFSGIERFIEIFYQLIFQFFFQSYQTISFHLGQIILNRCHYEDYEKQLSLCPCLLSLF